MKKIRRSLHKLTALGLSLVLAMSSVTVAYADTDINAGGSEVVESVLENVTESITDDTEESVSSLEEMSEGASDVMEDLRDSSAVEEDSEDNGGSVSESGIESGDEEQAVVSDSENIGKDVSDAEPSSDTPKGNEDPDEGLSSDETMTEDTASISDVTSDSEAEEEAYEGEDDADDVRTEEEDVIEVPDETTLLSQNLLAAPSGTYTVTFDYGAAFVFKYSDGYQSINASGELQWYNTITEAMQNANSTITIVVQSGDPLNRYIHNDSSVVSIVNGQYALMGEWINNADPSDIHSIDENWSNYIPSSDVTFSMQWEGAYEVSFDYGSKMYWEESGTYYYVSHNMCFPTSDEQEAKDNAEQVVRFYVRQGSALNHSAQNPNVGVEINGTPAVFERWLSSDGTESFYPYDDIYSYIPSRDIVFNAQWETNVYEINFDYGGETVNGKTHTKAYIKQGDSLGSAQIHFTIFNDELSANGLLPDYWETENGDKLEPSHFYGNEQVGLLYPQMVTEYIPVSNETLILHWTSDYHTVTMDYNGGIVNEEYSHTCYIRDRDVLHRYIGNEWVSLTEKNGANGLIADHVVDTDTGTEYELVWGLQNIKITSDKEFRVEWVDCYDVTFDYGTPFVWEDNGVYRYYDAYGMPNGTSDLTEAQSLAADKLIYEAKQGSQLLRYPTDPREAVRVNGTLQKLTGWMDADGTVYTVDDLPQFTPSGNTTLTPVWDTNLYLVVFDYGFPPIWYSNGQYCICQSYNGQYYETQRNDRADAEQEAGQRFEFGVSKGTPLGVEIIYEYGSAKTVSHNGDDWALKQWIGSKGTVLDKDKTADFVPTQDEVFTAVWEKAAQHTVTVHFNNGENDQSFDVVDGTDDRYSFFDWQISYPQDAVRYDIYVDNSFSQTFDAYVSANNGIHNDLDLHLKWIYQGNWVKQGDYYYYIYKTGNPAVDTLIEDNGDIYYLDAQGHRVENDWVILSADKWYTDEFGASTWRYYFGNDGKAYTYGIYQINGKSYVFDPEGHRSAGFTFDGVSNDYYSLADTNRYAVPETQYYCGSFADADDPDPSKNALHSGWLDYTIIDPWNGVENIYSSGDTIRLYYDPVSFQKLFKTSRTFNGENWAFDRYGIATKSTLDWYQDPANGNQWYYGLPDHSQYATNDFYDKDGQFRYVDANGYMVYDQLIYDGYNYYYFGNDGAMFTDKWKCLPYSNSADDQAEQAQYGVSERWYYFQANGKAKEDTIQKINGYNYGFDVKGRKLFGFTDNMIIQTGVDTFKSGDMYFGKNEPGKDGAFYQQRWLSIPISEVSDTVTYDGYPELWFWFDSDGIKMADRTNMINGINYRFDKNGVAVMDLITFDKLGGTGGDNSVRVLIGKKMPTITVPQRQGFQFEGYYLDPDDASTKYYNADGSSAKVSDFSSDTTLTAKWTQDKVIEGNTTISVDVPNMSADEQTFASELGSNTNVKTPADGLKDAVDNTALTAAINLNLPSGTTVDDADEIRLNVEVSLTGISSKAAFDGSGTVITKLEFDAEPYAELFKNGQAMSGSKTEIDNSMLSGTIRLRLPIPSRTNGSKAKVVHYFKDGGSEEKILDILGSGSDRYVEFDVSQFSKFEVTFINDGGPGEPDKLYWTVSDNTLRISSISGENQFDGTVAIVALTGGAPWDSQKDEITKVLIGDRDNNDIVAPIYTREWFSGLTNVTDIDLAGLDTSNVLSMREMFAECSSLTALDLSGFDTSSVTDMNGMFTGCSSLQNIDVSKFDTSKVTAMARMFNQCNSLKELDVSGFDVSNVTRMDSMFNECSSITHLDLRGFDASKATDMQSMFSKCVNLQELDLNGFKTHDATTMQNMFSGCEKLNRLDLSGFKTSAVTNMSYMFSNCSSLQELDVSGFDTSAVTNMRYMFSNCSGLKELDVSGFNTSSVTDMQSMFRQCSGLKELDVSGFDTANVTVMNSWFYDCSSLQNLNISGLDTSNVTDMRIVFAECSSLQELDVSSFNTSKATQIGGMFRNCSSLKELDVSGFDTSNVTSMIQLFYNCSGLKSLDVSGFDTSKVQDMSSMFNKCRGITELDLRSFDTENVTDMRYMLLACNSLKKVDLSSFDLKAVTNADDYFLGCFRLERIVSPKNLGSASSIALPATFVGDNDGKEYTVLPAGQTVLVKKEESPAVPVTGVSLDKESASLSIGKKLTLTATVSPSNADNKTLTWSTSDPNVAAVTNVGEVTAIKPGIATITVKTTDGGYTAACKVTVLFKDVINSSEYYFNPVYWAAENGITVGYTSGANAGKFGVDFDCQRRELLIFLWRYAGCPEGYPDARTMFNDLGSYNVSSATNKAIAWACTEGITKGYSDGGFHPTASIVRKDVMILLYRLAGKPAVSGSLTFKDCQNLKKGTDTYNAILWGSQKGITKGYSSGQYKGMFGNNLNCLREQIVTFLYRYDKL